MRVLRDLSCCCGSHWHGWFEEIFVFALKSNWLRSSVFQQVTFMWITACSYILLIKTLLVGKMPKSLWSFLEWWTIHTPIWAISEIATKSPNSFSLKNFLAYVYISMSIEKWLLLAPPTLFFIQLKYSLILVWTAVESRHRKNEWLCLFTSLILTFFPCQNTFDKIFLVYNNYPWLFWNGAILISSLYVT